MENRKVAQILHNIADILEIKGENPFRIRAYRRAAHNIEEFGANLVDMHRRGELTTIPGVGRELAAKVAEILDTGTCAYYENLIREIPPGMLRLLAIPGVGPRTARVLFEELQVTNLEDLERVARSGRLVKIRGFGAKTVQNVLRGLELVRRGRERFPLGQVLPFARELVTRLRDEAPVERISIAGSIRRFRDTVKDIDLVAASQKPEAVIAHFADLPVWAEVLERGTTRAAARTADGLRVDLRVVETEVYGAALCYLTGSKMHNIRLRELAARQGLKLSEYGLFRDGKRIAGLEEDDVYAALGLPFIPPELREDTGEIEAGLQGRLPRLLEYRDLKGDLHVHSAYSDGTGSLEMIADQARRLGLEWVGICDHSRSLKIAGGLSIAQLRHKISAIRAFNDTSPDVKLLAGTEVEIDPKGRLDYPDEVLAELDLVVAAVHTHFRQEAEAMTARLLEAIRHPNVHLIAHPTGRLLGERPPYPVDLDRVIAEAARTGTALELNAYPKRLDLDDTRCRQAAGEGVRLGIGSDAHTVEQMSFLEFGVGVARRAWLTPKDCLNTMSYRQLMTELGKFHLSDG
jgi:DNA polymerase (family 10)